jgi:drug/metabolite transporter (DMT)-like permease
MLIILSIVTLGIYGIVFWWGYVKDINRVCHDGEDSPNYIVVLLLSFITCGIYSLYWHYKQGNRLQAAAPQYNLSFQENGTSVLLWMVLGSCLCGVGAFVAMYILIKNLNAIGMVYNTQGNRA